MTDNEFIASFEAAGISREDWTHEAHVRMAWIYCSREVDLDTAMAKARSGIWELNAANGVEPELYHETVTFAFLTLTHHRIIANGGGRTWPEFRDGHPELFAVDEPVLLKYFDKDTLASDEARAHIVPPDCPYTA